MKRVLFFLLMIFVSFGVIADCEIQAKDHDCFTIFAKGTIFSAFPVLGSDSNLLIVFYVQIMPDDLVMQLHRF